MEGSGLPVLAARLPPTRPPDASSAAKPWAEGAGTVHLEVVRAPQRQLGLLGWRLLVRWKSAGRQGQLAGFFCEVGWMEDEMQPETEHGVGR